jgi:hypothetical protein
MEGFADFVRMWPPAGNGTTAANQVYTTAFTTAGTSTAEALVIPAFTSIDTGMAVAFISDADCHIRFGATGMAASTALDWYLPAGREKVWRLAPQLIFFRVSGHGAGAGGNLYRFKAAMT